jgi:hypothetical protein
MTKAKTLATFNPPIASRVTARLSKKTFERWP